MEQNDDETGRVQEKEIAKTVFSARPRLKSSHTSHIGSKTSAGVRAKGKVAERADGIVGPTSHFLLPSGGGGTTEERTCGSSTSSFGDLMIKFNQVYGVTVEVRNSFFHFRTSMPKMIRCASEPLMSKIASQASDTPCMSRSVAKDKLGIQADEGVPAGRQCHQPDSLSVEEGNACDVMTTVLIRDVPCKVGCERMMAELKLLGFDGCYDSIKFPIKLRNGKESCMGFGFVNFMDEATTTRFMTVFSGYRFHDISSEKRARVELAHLQGSSRFVIPARAPSSKKKRRQGCKADPHGLKAP